MNLLDRNRLNTGLNGEWLNDDEENGIHGTVLMAEDMNSLGTEINNLIKAGGMNPNKNENDQILRAVKNLGGSGVSSSASNVSYDNSISSLQQKNYDFPKFKSTIDDLTYISLNSVLGKIEKEENNYFLKGSVSVLSNQNVLPISLNMDSKEGYEVLSFIGQFFNIDYETRNIENVNWVDALEDEIIVNGINDGWQFVFVQNTLGIKRKDNGEIPENTYSVTLNIKNRVLLKPDENIIAWQIGINDDIVLKIVNENGNTKITGITNTYSNTRNEDIILFTNNILENYIALDTEHTIGITSSSGKNIIWTLKKSSLNYTISIKYDDSSQIQSEDFFSIDITADKNSNIDFSKGEALNVQNAIDSLSELKQNKLTAGENIVISEEGENTVIKSLGGGNAEGIGFDNRELQLQKIIGYDFPKFKTPIPDTINLVLTDNTNDYTAAITKQADGSYIFNCQLDNVLIDNVLNLTIKSIDDNSNIYQIYSILSQFFEYSTLSQFEHRYDAVANEINISGLSNEDYIFVFSITDSHILTIASMSGIPSSNYNITLNIKNRVLRNQDTNIFLANSTKSIFNLLLENKNGIIKLTGEIIANADFGTTELVGFYSPIIENYFNVNSMNNTAGIISSLDKPVKFGIIKSVSPSNSNSAYAFSIAHQDGSNIEKGEIFTFNLTPDKNSTVDPIYSTADNVQNAIEAIVQRLVLLESANKNI